MIGYTSRAILLGEKGKTKKKEQPRGKQKGANERLVKSRKGKGAAQRKSKNS